MKKIILSIAVGLIFCLTPLLTEAKDADSINVVVAEDETIDDNLVRAGNTFDIRGTVNGDVIVAGTNVEISGKVTGDVITAASMVKITGEVGGNLRAAGGTLVLDGKVGKNVNLFFATVNQGKDSEIGGSLAVWAGTVDLSGKVMGKIDGGAGSIVLGGEVKKDISLHFDAEKKDNNQENLSVLSTAVLEGDLNYYSDKEAKVESGATITGQLIRHEPLVVFKEANRFFNSMWWFARIAGLFGLLVIGMILVSVFKKEAKEIPAMMMKKVGISLLWGLLILFLTPIICFFLLFTVIGIPLAVITLILYGILIYISQIFVGIFIGQKILEYFRHEKRDENSVKKEISPFWSMIVGVTVYVLFLDIILGYGVTGSAWYYGWLGGLIKFIALIWVVGAFYSQKRENMANKHKNLKS
ncbi:MAG: polymer-forming cytoskeletal protein [Patescibacteria group bacterium]